MQNIPRFDRCDGTLHRVALCQMNSSTNLTFGISYEQKSNGSFRDETITRSQTEGQLPAQALSNPFGYALLSPLMMALNHGFSH